MAKRWRHRRQRQSSNFRQNVGRPGVVYVLENPGLRAGYLKIGCSTRSGHARANDLNRDAGTGTPGSFRCVFEHRTADCGGAEERVFQRVAVHRRGKRGQEFFEIELTAARSVIIEECAAADAEFEKRASRVAPGSPPLPPRSPVAPAAATGLLTGPAQEPYAAPSSLRQLPEPQKTPKLQPRWLNTILMTFGLGILATQLVAIVFGWWEGSLNQTGVSSSYFPTRSPHAGSAIPSGASQAVRSPPPNLPHGGGHVWLPPESSGKEAKADKAGTSAKAAGSRSDARDVMSAAERASAESACSTERMLEGPAAYTRCMTTQLGAWSKAPKAPDLSAMSEAERASAESACSTERMLNGPAAYNRCMTAQLRAWSMGPKTPDLSAMTEGERTSAESACSTERMIGGPAACNRCMTAQLAAWSTGPKPPDLSAMTDAERASAESACSTQRMLRGPAAYNRCMTSQHRALRLLRR